MIMADMTLIGGIVLVLIIIAGFIAYVYTLVHQAKKKDWTWFVLTLLIAPVMIIYWIVKLFK